MAKEGSAESWSQEPLHYKTLSGALVQKTNVFCYRQSRCITQEKTVNSVTKNDFAELQPGQVDNTVDPQ